MKHSIKKVLANPRYKGKHLIITRRRVFATTTAKETAKLFDRATKQHPHQKLTLAYIPREDTLITWEEHADRIRDRLQRSHKSYSDSASLLRQDRAR